MKRPGPDYELIEVESYEPDRTSGLHGKVHIRPALGGPFSPDLRVECSKKLSDPALYPVGTRFRLWAKLVDYEGTPFLYSSWRWPADVVPSRELAR